MDWHGFLIGIAFFMIFEGIVPFLAPKLFKNHIEKMLSFSEQFLRAVGLVFMAAGVILLYLIR